jgi:serine/threonine protein kinase
MSPVKLAERSAVIDQAYDEYCQLAEGGASPDPDEFCDRFPDCRTSLRRLLEAHRFFAENPDLLPDAEPRWPEPGETFLGLTVRAELGRGAFARVYLVGNPDLGGKPQVVKVSRHGAAEARTVGPIIHANVVDVIDVATDPGTGLTAIRMPYRGGATLNDVLDRLPVTGPPEQAALLLQVARDGDLLGEAPLVPAPGASYVGAVVRIGVALADALAHLHKNGVLHRDLKPSNVLLTPAGEPVLLDFNLSADGCEADAAAGGTLPYMPPEQLRAAGDGGPAPADPRSDIFALGVILYELLAGRHPFGPIPLKLTVAHTRDLLTERHQLGPLPLRQSNRRVCGRLARLIENCLARDPSGRPQSAAELAAGLRQCLILPRWVPTRRRAFQAAGLAVLLTATVLSVRTFDRSRPDVHVPSGAPSAEQEWEQGLIDLRAGRFADAERHFEQALRDDPNRPKGRYHLGRARLKRGNYPAAIIDLQRAAATDRDGPTLASLGYALSRQKQHGEAVLNYRASIEAGGGSAEVYNDLAFSLLALSEDDLALEELNKALKLKPDLQAALHNRALTHLRLAKFQPGPHAQAGLVDVEAALKLGPETSELDRHSASLYALNGRKAEALLYLNRAVDNGLRPEFFRNDRYFQAYKNDLEFKQLLGRKAPADLSSLPSTRLVDPVRD